jgi:c-di-GMP-related signal transduction protein
MQQVLQYLPSLAPQITDALLRGAGPYGELLTSVLAYEQGDWKAIAGCGLPALMVRDAYLDALNYAAETANQFRSQREP